MKKSVVLFFLITLSLTTFAQRPRPAKKLASATKTIAAKIGGEKEEFDKAVAQTSVLERINLLQKFIENFPKSGEKTHALELIVSARAEIAEEKLRGGDAASGVEFFKLAVKDAPPLVSDKLFTEILLQIPTNLFFRSQQASAVEVAKMIEERIDGNANQLLGLATFYLGTENADEAKRLANKAIAINPNLPAAYQTLGLANRLNFQLDEAVNSYAKALELDVNSSISRRSLAEMKRAVGKSDEAIALYREILTKDETDIAAQTGLTLALFDADKRGEAETAMQKSLAQNPDNLPLLVGAAYWYAAHEDGAKTVELAQRAIAVEPRYTWAYIALGRGFLQQKHFLEAEKALLTAKRYGNFPTLNYEIASVRLAAGFYREAAEELKKSFAVKDGSLQTRLGGRVAVEAKNFIELLSLERRASIFEPLAADSSENADRIKSLLDFSQKLEAADADETIVSEAVNEFVKGDDKMKVHRQIFAANRLLENKKALPKVLELTRAAIGGVDSSLEVANPAAAILADELYESRTIAIIRGQVIIVPDVPRQTLLNILRGRIEDISGWALYQQGKTSEAVVRLKRAVSVLPEKSAWSRASLWRLGTALDADGKSKEALEAYIKSYSDSEPSQTRRIIIESVYQKINGSLEGLDEKIGTKPASAVSETNSRFKQSETIAQNSVNESPVVQTTPQPELNSTPETVSSPVFSPAPIQVSEPTPAITPTPTITPEQKATPETTPTITPEPSPMPTIELIAQAVAEKKQPLETKPENSPAPLPSPETRAEDKPAIDKLDSKDKPAAEKPNPENKLPTDKPDSEVSTDAASKSLFEPIVITVPNSKTPNPKVGDVEEGGKAQAEENEGEKTSSRKKGAEASRPRVVSEKKGEAPAAEIAQCKINVSQENISLINGGGNLGILINLEGTGNLKKLVAASSSPNDIEVTLEPEIGTQSAQAFFIVKSISSNKGVYTVTFEMPCGKKNVVVKVR